ncbi:hypothetical protein ABKV19_014970 [Rosa sericea]
MTCICFPACRNLRLKYLNLYLIHWPVSLKTGSYDFPVNKEHLLPIDFKGVWEAMEECQKLGHTKSIGVCNFSCKKIETLLATANSKSLLQSIKILIIVLVW